MDLHEAIKTRRTIHSFSTKQVQETIIERAIDAANQAPCHRHTFPWRFFSIDLKRRELLANLALELKFANRLVDEAIKEKVLQKILNPSHLLVASQVVNPDQKIRLEDYAACACAIQNLSLSLVADGVGSKWSTGKITTDKKTYRIVGINPQREEIIGFIWVGYGEIPLQIKRPQISSIFRGSSLASN